MKDIRTLVPEFTPLEFKDKFSLLYVGDQYIGVSFNIMSALSNYEDNTTLKNTYSILTDFIPATAITVERIGSADFLIGWFDLNDFSEFTVAHVGIAVNGLEVADFEYLEKYIEVDDYKYLKSIQPVSTARLTEIIKDKVTLLDSAPIEKMTDISSSYYRRSYHGNGVDKEIERLNKDKIAIPYKIQPIKQNDYSNIRFAKINMQIFGGNSVIPFVWLQRTKLQKKETLYVHTNN